MDACTPTTFAAPLRRAPCTPASNVALCNFRPLAALDVFMTGHVTNSSAAFVADVATFIRRHRLITATGAYKRNALFFGGWHHQTGLWHGSSLPLPVRCCLKVNHLSGIPLLCLRQRLYREGHCRFWEHGLVIMGLPPLVEEVWKLHVNPRVVVTIGAAAEAIAHQTYMKALLEAISNDLLRILNVICLKTKPKGQPGGVALCMPSQG